MSWASAMVSILSHLIQSMGELQAGELSGLIRVRGKRRNLRI
jgi:hypothetical protein